MEGNAPPKDLPAISADFNAIGWSGEENDNCCYSLHCEKLKEISPREGMRIFIYDDDIDEDGKPEIFGCVAILEKIDDLSARWRARPIESTWFRGTALWQCVNKR